MRIVAPLMLLFATACGSRTGLPLGAGSDDASVSDAAPPVTTPPDFPSLPPPDCGTRVPVGSLRGAVTQISGRASIDDVGNVYAPRRYADDDWTLVSVDPCLEPRFETPIVGLDDRDRIFTVVDSFGDVWVVRGRGDGVWRFRSDGSPRPVGLAFEGRLGTWLGIPDSAGPIFSTSLSVDEKYLYRFAASGVGDRVRLPMESSFVWSEECLVSGPRAACHNIAYDRGSLEQDWIRENPRIVDGTLRNIVMPASDGERMWTVRFGISTYELVAHDLSTGREELSTLIARSTSGQVDMVVSPPVLSPSGVVFTYVHVRREAGGTGALEAFSLMGEPMWSVPAPATEEVFGTDGNLLVGRNGIVYLAVGSTVCARGTTDGEAHWCLELDVDFNEPQINLSPNGDLFVRSAAEALYVIRTASPGLAPSPWPAPGGSHRFHNSR